VLIYSVHYWERESELLSDCIHTCVNLFSTLLGERVGVTIRLYITCVNIEGGEPSWRYMRSLERVGLTDCIYTFLFDFPTLHNNEFELELELEVELESELELELRRRGETQHY
jgi:hypothetical protein